MRLLGRVGVGILAVGIALGAACAADAQNSQSSSQQNGQQQNGNNGTAPTTNLPYYPPAPPPGGTGDAETGSYSGRGSTQSGASGSYGNGQNGSSSVIGHIAKDNPLAEDTPANQQQMEQQQARARNAERQKQLISDTQKLVALVNELQDEVNKSNKDMLSLDVVRKADEIDKLARTVRDKMKNAN